MTERIVTLIRLAEADVDERRRELAELLGRAEELEGKARALAREIERERQAARDDPQVAGAAYGAWAETAEERRRQLDKALVALERDITAALESVAVAYRRQRSLELAKAARDERAAIAAARAEQAQLDEIAIERFRRRA